MSDLLKVSVGGSNYLCKWSPSYVEIGGRKYHIVKIGPLLWIKENLDYKFDSLHVNPLWQQSVDDGWNSAWYYDEDESTYGLDGPKPCGLLYNGRAAKYLNDNRATLLPDGWHVPSYAELETLQTYAGNSNAGKNLKAEDGEVWPVGWGGTDTYGFHLLPSGYYYGNFGEIDVQTTLWSNNGRSRAKFEKTKDSISYGGDNLNGGHSIRLCKEDT